MNKNKNEKGRREKLMDISSQVALVRVHRDVEPSKQRETLEFIKTTLLEWAAKLQKSQEVLRNEIEYIKETGRRLDREAGN